MDFVYEKNIKTCETLKSLSKTVICSFDELEYTESDYKTSNVPPALSGFRPLYVEIKGLIISKIYKKGD